jgi:hypothetical protein
MRKMIVRPLKPLRLVEHRPTSTGAVLATYARADD